MRPIDGTAFEFVQCSPLLGLKVGVAKRYPSDWELVGAVGVGISLVNADDKVKEHELFADLEVNKYLSRGTFVGTGVSLWDLTRRDTFAPAWMLHVGVPLAKSSSMPVFLLIEGRVFFNAINDVRNNYQIWGGVRVHFGT